MSGYIKYYVIINLIFTYEQKLFKVKKPRLIHNKSKDKLGKKTDPSRFKSNFLSNEFQEILLKIQIIFHGFLTFVSDIIVTHLQAKSARLPTILLNNTTQMS